MGETNITILKCLIFILCSFYTSYAQNFQYGLCADPHCSEPIALGITILKYFSSDPEKLSCVENEEVTIFVTEYGEKKQLIGVLLNGKRGYLPKQFVKETKTLKRNLVPAQFEFTQPNLQVSSYHVTSHVHTSVHPHYTDVHHSVQPSVPNSFNLVPNVQHNSVPLESSRGEPSHFHPSDQHQVSMESFSNNHLQGDNPAHQTTQMHHSSHTNIAFGASNPTTYAEVNSQQTGFPSQNQFSTFAQPSIDQRMASGGNQNFEFQSNTLFHSSFDTSPENNLKSSVGNQQFFSQQSDVLLPSPTQQETTNQMAAQVHNGGQNLYTQSNNLLNNQGYQTNTPSQPFTEGQNVNYQGNTFSEQGSPFYPNTQVPQETRPFDSQSNFFADGTSPEMHSEKQNYNFHSSVQFQQPPVQSPQVSVQTPSGHVGQPFVPTNPHFYNQFHHTTTVNEVTQSQQAIPPQSNFPPVIKDNNPEFDETMAMLQSRGINPEGERTKEKFFPGSTIDPSSPFPNNNVQHHTHGIDKVLVSGSTIDPSSPFPNTNVEHHTHGTDKVLVSGSTIDPSSPFPNSNVEHHTHGTDKVLASNSIRPDQSYSGFNTQNFHPDSSIQDKSSFSEQKSEYVLTEDLSTKYTRTEEFQAPPSEIFTAGGELNSVFTKEEIEEIVADYDDEEEEDDEEDDTSNMLKEEKVYNHGVEQPADESITKSSVKPSTQPTQDNSKSKLDTHMKLSQLEKAMGISPEEINSLSKDTEYPLKKDHSSTPKESHDSLKRVNVDETITKGYSKSFSSETSEVKPSTPIDALKVTYTDQPPMSIDNSSLPSNLGNIEKKIADFIPKDIEKNNLDTLSTDLLEDKDDFKKRTNSFEPNHASDANETDEALAYQTRHLKDVENNNDNAPPVEESESNSDAELSFYDSLQNFFEAVRYFTEGLLPWIPDPLYTIIIDLEKDGISPKVTVFTALSAIPCIVLMVLLVCIKEKSKEKELIAQLTILEKNHYNLTAEKNILEEKLEKSEVELQISRTALEEAKVSSFKLKTEIESLKQQLEETTVELEKTVDIVDALKEKEREYIESIRENEKEHLNLLEQKSEIETSLEKVEATVSDLSEDLEKKDAEIQKLLSENSEYLQANEVYEEKLSQLQKNCNQLLKEAEIWNARVNELNEKLNREVTTRGELENTITEKDNEIKALQEAVQIFKSFEEMGNDNEEERKTNEEKLQHIINSSKILLQLNEKEEENKILSERLEEEKNKLLDLEVSILDVKSENDKLKINYNQALQDKAEAQTKLEVLTNYFKDKEIQLQRQLGVQEAVRQKTEEDASSAERRICLIEQENSSYKYQVATMKQEMEETERNLKNQIAIQEKKAHENWLAARTAERKLEDTKQEVMQLRQRLTLLEREQEKWTNSAREEIVRPVPKRLNNENDNTLVSQDNSSMDLRPNIFPPPPMMLPLDRPLPPLPPPLPPFPPFEPPPFRPQPWHMPPLDSLSNSSYRITPPDYSRGRESTPPRGRSSAVNDGDMGPRQSSPLGDMRDSRNSTPPHFLPDFHDIPPHPPRPFFPPMGPHPRYPLPPPPQFRKEMSPGPRRIDNQDESNSNYGSQHPPVPQDSWHNPNSRV